MNDPRQVTHRPMPKPAASPGLVDPLVATSHAQSAPPPARSQQPADKISITDDEPIALVDDASTHPAAPAPGSPSASRAGLSDSAVARRIVAFGTGEGKQFSEKWRREPVRTGTGAIRVKSFHGKYSDEGLRYLDHAINKWLDDHPEVEVKFVTPTVMTFEGKIREPALVLNVWY